jgi:hypothetical protein
MNIFILHNSPVKAAEYHCDKHVVKMIIEYGQILATSHRLINGIPGTLARFRAGKSPVQENYGWVLPGESTLAPRMPLATHIHHPCVKWATASSGNYVWVYCLFVALLREYTRRYGRVHPYDRHVETFSDEPDGIHRGDLTPFVCAMPGQYHHIDDDPVVSYRLYYAGDKRRFATWKTKVPSWWEEYRTMSDTILKNGIMSI